MKNCIVDLSPIVRVTPEKNSIWLSATKNKAVLKQASFVIKKQEKLEHHQQKRNGVVEQVIKF